MPTMLERIPDDTEFYFRCRFHSITLLGKPAMKLDSRNWYIDLSKMECPAATIESDCTLAGNNWEIFYRRQK